MTDNEFENCMRQIQKGKKEGLQKIYEAYIGLIYTVIYNLLGRKEDAQDITSEFFIRLWEKADTYRFGGKHRGWLVSIARNMAIDFIRKNKKELLVEEIQLEEQTEDFVSEVISQISIEEAMALLNVNEQEVMDLKVIGEFTFKEISEILQKPMGTVTWLYRNGIAKLRCSKQEEV